MASGTVCLCSGWCDWEGRGGGLASSVNWEELAERIHSWPWPRCIIVHSDPENILNHQSKQSDAPVKTQAEGLCSTARYCCPGSQACAPLWKHRAHGLRRTSCLWVAALFRIDVGSIHSWCYHFETLENWITKWFSLFIFFCLSG